MHWVPTPPIKPHRCAVVPFISRDEEGFIDTGSEMDGFDNHVYVSVKAVKEMGRLIGMVHGGLLVDAEQHVAELEAQLAEAAEENDALRHQFEAIDVLRRVGLTPQKEKV